MGREQSMYHYPANRAVLEQAGGVIVHSRHAIDLAESWYGEGSANDWTMVPLLRVLPGSLDRVAARRQLGLEDDDFVLCTFGLMGVTKCNDKLLEAWLNSPLGSDEKCHLVFVGENNILQFGRDLVARINNHPRIKITGFASQELYRQYLCAADAGVQLRSRSRGETSASVLDCLAYRLPTIINAHGSAAEIADHVTLKLADAFSEAELASAILRLRHEPALRRELSDNAAAYMEALHHPARIGARYHDVIEGYAHDSAAARYRQLMLSLGAVGTATTASEQDLVQTAAAIAANRTPTGVRQLLVDVTELEGGRRDGVAGHIERTLIRQLLQVPPSGYRVEPVRRLGDRYYYARRYTLDHLIDRPELVLDDSAIDLQAGDNFLAFGGAGPDAVTLYNRGVGHAMIACDDATATATLPTALATLLKSAGTAAHCLLRRAGRIAEATPPQASTPPVGGTRRYHIVAVGQPLAGSLAERLQTDAGAEWTLTVSDGVAGIAAAGELDLLLLEGADVAASASLLLDALDRGAACLIIDGGDRHAV